MSSTTDFDGLARAWLADGPTELSDRTLGAALAQIHLTRQRRASRAPWRFPKMSNVSTSGRTVLVGALLVVAVVGAGMLVGGGPPVTPTNAPPTATTVPQSPVPAPSLAFTAEFQSGIFGYAARRPIGWTATFGTSQGSPEDLALGGHDRPTPFWDRFTPPGQIIIVGGLLATSTTVPTGMSEGEWIGAYQAPQLETVGAACVPQRSTWDVVTVDGRAGGIYVGCQFVEAMVFVDRRVYVFYYVNTQGNQATVESGGRDLLQAFLDTVSLDPDGATPPSQTPVTSLETQ